MVRSVRVSLAVALAASALGAQTRQAARKAPPEPALERAQAQVFCPSVLGTGVATKRTFCDVMIGRDPGDGILIRVPPHRGPATLSFELHTRQTVSEEQVKARRAYARHTATIGILTLDNTLLTRAVVQTEFRALSDLFDRIGGGAGPGGVKAVAPAGNEDVSVTLPEEINEVSILGEKLTVVRLDGNESFVVAGRPIATISNVMAQFRALPPPRAPGRTKKARN